jgi:hypothetical protein
MMFLITYECQGRKAYDTCENVVEWLLSVNDYKDAPYFILNVVPLTDTEHKEIDGELAGM